MKTLIEIPKTILDYTCAGVENSIIWIGEKMVDSMEQSQSLRAFYIALISIWLFFSSFVTGLMWFTSVHKPLGFWNTLIVSLNYQVSSSSLLTEFSVVASMFSVEFTLLIIILLLTIKKHDAQFKEN